MSKVSEMQFEAQTFKIVPKVFYLLLSDQGVPLHQLRGAQALKSCDSERDDLHQAIFKACKLLLEDSDGKIKDEVDKLDISPSCICQSYHVVANQLFVRDCNWSLVLMLFVFSSFTAARAYHNGDRAAVESIQMWLAWFVCRNLKNWMMDHEGWEGLRSYFSPERRRSRISRAAEASTNNDTPWWRIAATWLGLIPRRD